MVTRIGYNSEKLASILSPSSNKKHQNNSTLNFLNSNETELLSNEPAPAGLITPKIVSKNANAPVEQNSFLEDSNNFYTTDDIHEDVRSSQDTAKKHRRKKKTELESLLESSPLRSSWYDNSNLSVQMSPDPHSIQFINSPYSNYMSLASGTREPRITRRVSKLLESGLFDTPSPSSSSATINSFHALASSNSIDRTNSFINAATIPSFLLPRENTAKSENDHFHTVKNILSLSFEKLKSFKITKSISNDLLHTFSATVSKLSIQLAYFFSASYEIFSLVFFWMICFFTSCINFIRKANYPKKKNLLFKISFGIVIFGICRMIYKGMLRKNYVVKEDATIILQNTLNQLTQKQNLLESELIANINRNIEQIKDISKQQSISKSETLHEAFQIKKDIEKLIERTKSDMLEIINSKANFAASIANQYSESFPTLSMFDERNSAIVSSIAELKSLVNHIEPEVAALNAKMEVIQNENDALIRELSTVKSKSKELNGTSLHGIDYALESMGAQIVHSLTSPTFKSSRFLSLLGIGIEGKPPESILSNNNSLGNCWSFAGSSGNVVIELKNSILPTAFGIEHVPLEYAINPSTAPREIEIYALSSAANENGILLCKITFDLSYGNIQAFPLFSGTSFSATSFANQFKYYRINVLSNNGCARFTCLYKVRIYGKELNK